MELFKRVFKIKGKKSNENPDVVQINDAYYNKSDINRLIADYEFKIGSEFNNSQPFGVHLLAQQQCNYSCEFCGFDYRTQALKGQMTLDAFKTIYKNLGYKNVGSFTFSGQGEPFLCKDIEPISRYIKSINKEAKIGINTNGELINDERINILSELFDIVVISLHSMEKETYKKLTSRDALDKVISNIKALRKSNPDLHINLYFAYSKSNIHEIKSHIQFCSELGNCSYTGAYMKFYDVKRRFSDRNNVSLNIKIENDDSLFFHQEYSDAIVKDAIEYAQSINYTQVCFPPLFSVTPVVRANCESPYKGIMVDFDGTVFPCGGSDIWMYDEIKEGKLNFGNLMKNTISEVWNLADYQKLRRSCRANANNREIRHCEDCTSLGFLVNSGNLRESHFNREV